MTNKGLKVFNSLTGRKEPFVPLEHGKVGMYVCGPTTYNYIHLGNARPLVVFDTVRRYLEYQGFTVTYVQNFTDVDDKIIKRSQEEGIPPKELAEKYVQEYFRDAEALAVKQATFHPKVSDHMEDIIAFIQGLIEKGYAYELAGDVYYEVEKFPGYGKLSGRTLDELQAGARVGIDERKRHPGDFALWKKAKPGEPYWDSPFGEGRPGWHIECSVMSHKYLGSSFDIHAGGYDLIFPHHENEIAQSEAQNGVIMAKYWLHNGFITVNQEKMSKSLGNFFLLRDILKKYAPEVVRFYLLSTHYRSPLDFDDEKLEASRRSLARLQNSYRLLKETLDKGVIAEGAFTGAPEFKETVEDLRQQFVTAMNDDFNTALAIAVLFDFARAINTIIASGPLSPEGLNALEAGGRVYLELASVLGIGLESEGREDSSLVASLLDLILTIRQEARARKDYQTADKIRESLQQSGIIIEDTPQGARWRYQ